MSNEEELKKIMEQVNGTGEEQTETPTNNEVTTTNETILTDEEKKKRAYEKQALLEEYAKSMYEAQKENTGAKISDIYKELNEQSGGTPQELIEQVRKVKRIYEATEITKANKEPIYICNDIDDALILENNGKNAILTELNKKVNDKYIKTSYIKEITGNKKAMKRNYILATRTETREELEELEKELKQNKIKFTPLVLIKDTQTQEQDTIENYYKYCYDNDQMDLFLQNIDPFNNLSNFNYLVYNFENDLKEHQEHKQINTGFKRLDFILNGLNPGLYVLGARVKYR